MKKIFVLLLAFPVFVNAQNNNVISVDRYFPKADKVAQFEKALAAHAQKFHKGDTKWLVLTVETGPDAGAYQVVEGPKTWESVDKRGDLGKAHMDDWNATVQPTLTDKVSFSYLTFRKDLSTVAQTDYAEKIAITHVFYRPGYYDEIQEALLNMKKVWEQSDQSIAVYEASASGEPQFTVVTRYTKGLKERDSGFRESFPIRYKKVHGQDGWDKFVKGSKEIVSHQWSEMLFVKRDLGSK